MDITNGFVNLRNLYDTQNYNVNQVLRLDYDYNGLSVSLIYTQANHAEHEFVLVLHIDNTHYPLSFHVNVQNEHFIVNPFFNYNYKDINRHYYQENGVSLFPGQMIDYIFNNIHETNAITENARYVANAYHNVPNHECPYYRTYKRVKMSPKMKQKIRDKYDNAEEIITFFDDNNCTLVFTADISLAHELVLEL